MRNARYSSRPVIENRNYVTRSPYADTNKMWGAGETGLAEMSIGISLTPDS